jgi:hypothetical protein
MTELLFIAGKTGLYTYDRGNSQGVCPLGMCSSSPLDWSQNIVTASMWLECLQPFIEKVLINGPVPSDVA